MYNSGLTEMAVTTLAIIAAVVIFRAIWSHAAPPPIEDEVDDHGFDASAARWGYLQDKRNK